MADYAVSGVQVSEPSRHTIWLVRRGQDPIAAVQVTAAGETSIDWPAVEALAALDEHGAPYACVRALLAVRDGKEVPV